MSMKSIFAVLAVFLAGLVANPSAANPITTPMATTATTAKTTPFGFGPTSTGPIGPNGSIWIGITNAGTTTVRVSNVVIKTNGQQVVLSPFFDNCSTALQQPSAACSIGAVLPQDNVAVWAVMQATSTTGLRGVAQVLDSSGRSIIVLELK